MAEVVEVPQWTERFTKKDVGGEDQLGVEGMAQSYQQYLIPGVISTTDHARYYSFYCWVLYRYINLPDSPRTVAGFRGRFFKRHELSFIAGCYSHHREYEFLTGLVGGGVNNYKARRIWDSAEPIALDDHLDYFGNKQGGFGQYYRPVMQTMGLVGEAESPTWIYPLTHRGKELAEAYDANIDGTSYKERLDRSGEISKLSYEEAKEYGEQACICPSALATSADRELLLDAFFRFDQEKITSSHVRRRLTIAVILELVEQSNDSPLRDTLRNALYLGWYQIEQQYEPHSALADWYQRWQLVQMRHLYTATLQSLWAVFLDKLYAEEEITFEAFMDWVVSFLQNSLLSIPIADYLDELCSEVGLIDEWEQAAKQFHAVCQEGTGFDEMMLFESILESDRSPVVMVPNAMRILCQFYLRHYEMWQRNDSIWQEMANQERLPVEKFMNDLHEYVLNGRSVEEWLSYLYRDYCIGQHEAIALRKLRQQTYNTFKFYYQDEGFTWAGNPWDYSEPLRFPGMRLFNGLTILTDLGLVVEDENGICSLTDDGLSYLARSVGA